MKLLQEQFLVGFSEGWTMFWSPFSALAREVKKTWVSHVPRRGSKQQHA